MSLTDGHWLFAENLFIPTNGNCIAASGSQEFFVAGGDVGQNSFAEGILMVERAAKWLLEVAENCISKKKFGGFGLVWFLQKMR